MMIYLPRPSESDLEAKYAALSRFGDNVPGIGEAPERTRLRSQRIYKLVKAHLNQDAPSLRVLDFGGGDGRLLLSFIESGSECDLIDYCAAPIAGANQIGPTIDSLSPARRYDAIICNHVMEHLARPLEILRKLVRNLSPGGVIYVEVPVEMVKRMPAGTEPVTHCNFFIPESLSTLMQRAGCRVISCRLYGYPHPNGGWTLCAGAIGVRARKGRTVTRDASAIYRYLHPSPWFLAYLMSKIWRGVPAILKRKFFG
jgi:SAM-dependent methyltransferase